MNLDPDMVRLLESISIDFQTPVDWAGARAAAKALEPLLVGPEGAARVKSVEEHRIHGTDGALDVRLYRPEGAPAMTVVHFHGGGWALGDLDMHDHTVRKICRRLGAIVVSCTYRLAPENPFPAAYNDALAATRWVLSQIEALGGDPGRVVIAGDSGGGNLVAAVTLALRDEARLAAAELARPLPALRAQLLLYPGVDVRDSARQAASFVADQDPSISSAMIGECISAYVQGGQHGDWRVSPLAAADFSGLPPALVVVLSVDPLRDQAVAYAARLQEAGVPCELIEFAHLTHGFCHIRALVPAAELAFDEVLARFEFFVNLGNGGK
ncbi:MAG: alpha/beta hydrolase [Pseudomonadota bacterium]